MNIEGSFDPDERRREAMMEGSGFSSHLADARLDEEIIPGTTEASRSPRSPRKSPRTRVRGFYEGEKRLSEEFPNTEDLSAEQAATNNEWIAKIRKSMGDTAIQRIVDSVERMIPIDPDNVAKSLEERERMTNARLRTHFDRKG